MDQPYDEIFELLSNIVQNTRQINFYQFQINFLRVSDMVPGERDTLLQHLLEASHRLCRGQIGQSYIWRHFFLVQRAITLYFRRQIVGFILFDTTGYIYLTCAMEFPVRIRAGLFLRCLAHVYLLVNENLDEVYSDAINSYVAGYYASLGYKFGKEECYHPDEITDQFDIYREHGGEDAVDFTPFLPPDYLSGSGYRMKFCGEPYFCVNAYNNFLRDVAEAITQGVM